MRGNQFESQLERLARTLTEQFGVRVVCQGDNAWTDGRQIVWMCVGGARCGMDRIFLYHKALCKNTQFALDSGNT